MRISPPRSLYFECLPVIDTTDLEPATPGLQLDCTVTTAAVIRHDGTATIVEGDAMPQCAMLDDVTPDPEGARPSWRAVTEPSCNEWSAHLGVRAERDDFPPRR